MRHSWKTALAVSALALIASIAARTTMAAGHPKTTITSHSAAGKGSLGKTAGFDKSHSDKGHFEKGHFDKNRYDGRYRDFFDYCRSWYGDRYGRYGYGCYPNCYPLLPDCASYCVPSCPSCPSCCSCNPPCPVFAPSCPCYPACVGSCCQQSYGCYGSLGSYGGWGYPGYPYRHHDPKEHSEKDGRHRPGSLGSYGHNGGMLSHVAMSSSHGGHR